MKLKLLLIQTITLIVIVLFSACYSSQRLYTCEKEYTTTWGHIKIWPDYGSHFNIDCSTIKINGVAEIETNEPAVFKVRGAKIITSKNTALLIRSNKGESYTRVVVKKGKATFVYRSHTIVTKKVLHEKELIAYSSYKKGNDRSFSYLYIDTSIIQPIEQLIHCRVDTIYVNSTRADGCVQLWVEVTIPEIFAKDCDADSLRKEGRKWGKIIYKKFLNSNKLLSDVCITYKQDNIHVPTGYDVFGEFYKREPLTDSLIQMIAQLTKCRINAANPYYSSDSSFLDLWIEAELPEIGFKNLCSDLKNNSLPVRLYLDSLRGSGIRVSQLIEEQLLKSNSPLRRVSINYIQDSCSLPAIYEVPEKARLNVPLLPANLKKRM